MFDNFTLNNLLNTTLYGNLKTISQIQIGTHEERLNLQIIKSSSSMINFEDGQASLVETSLEIIVPC